MKEHIQAIFVYIAANFLILNQIAKKVQIFEISNTNRITSHPYIGISTT